MKTLFAACEIRFVPSNWKGDGRPFRAVTDPDSIEETAQFFEKSFQDLNAARRTPERQTLVKVLVAGEFPDVESKDHRTVYGTKEQSELNGYRFLCLNLEERAYELEESADREGQEDSRIRRLIAAELRAQLASPAKTLSIDDFEYAHLRGNAAMHARPFLEAAAFLLDRLPDCSDRTAALAHLHASRSAVLCIVARADEGHRQQGGSW